MNDFLFYVLFLIVAVGIPAATGIAILKYRLYGFDLVIRRTLVFGALAAVITAIYLGVVVLIGTIATESLVPSPIATAIVAALFQPIRRRVVRLADRLVFGRRAQPYEVLARFSDRVGASYAADDVIPRTARVIAEGVGATHVEIWLRVGEDAHLAAAWPDGDVPSTAPTSGRSHRRNNSVRSDSGPHPVSRSVPPRRSSWPTSRPRPPSSSATWRSRASSELGWTSCRRGPRSSGSRGCGSSKRTTRRRRLERNIHDGAQQHLVALAVKLRLASAGFGSGESCRTTP